MHAARRDADERIEENANSTFANWLSSAWNNLCGPWNHHEVPRLPLSTGDAGCMNNLRDS